MAKMKGKKVNLSGKPKHSFDTNRIHKTHRSKKGSRNAATVGRPRMYSTKPKRNRMGKVLMHEFQSIGQSSDA